MATAVTEGMILDHLAAAIARAKVYGRTDIRSYFCLHLSSEVRVAFDLFLVRTKDPLAFEAGSCEQRFFTRVSRMLDLTETGLLPA